MTETTRPRSLTGLMSRVFRRESRAYPLYLIVPSMAHPDVLFSSSSHERAGSNYSDGGTPPPRSRKKSRHSEPKIGNESKSRKIKIVRDHLAYLLSWSG
jgi:hypothetical protein